MLWFLLLGFLTPGALARTTGSLQGEFSVPYSCDLETPSAVELAVGASRKRASSNAAFRYGYNGRTDFELGAVSVLSSNPQADVSARIIISDGVAEIIRNASPIAAEKTQGRLDNAVAATGSVSFELIENTAPTLHAGDYTIVSSLSCSQAL